MSSVPPNVRDVTDFQFKKLRALQVFDQLGKVSEKSHNLLAVSNKYGLVFVGGYTSIRVIRTEDIEQLDEDKSLMRVDATDYPFQAVELPASITDLALNCDSLTLAACVLLDQRPHVYLYDVRAFGEKSTKILPFTGFELASNNGSSLVDFLWNPAMPSLFATCFSDGCVIVCDVSDSTWQIYGSLPPETAATAICWSPKGKQLAVGRRNGTLTQHTPELKVAKTVPAPYIYENEVAVVTIAWLSSYQFAVVYCVEDRPCLVLVNAPKSNKPTFTDFDDVCFGSSEQRPLRYYMLHVPEMHLLICSSSNALDVAVLSNKEGDGSVWEQWNLEDSGRAELPLLGNDETYPLGMTLNVTAQHQILVNDTDFVSPKPLLHILSTGGILLSYHIFGAELSTQSLMKPPEALVPSGMRHPAATSTPGTTFNAAAAKVNLLPKFNEALRFSPAAAFAQPASGASPVVSTTKEGSSLPVLATTTGSSFPALATTTGSSFIPPMAATRSSFIAPTATTHAPSTFGHFGQIVSGKPIASGSITTGTPLLGTGLEKSSQMQPLAPAQSLSSAITNAKFVPAFTFAISNLTTPSSTSTKTGLAWSANNLAGKRPQVDSGVTGVPAVAPPVAKLNKDPVLKPKLAKRGQGQTALVLALMEELSKFDVEVQQAKKRTSVLMESIATEEEDNIRAEIGQLNNFLQEAKAATRSMNAEIHVLRGGILDSFTAFEEGLSLESRSRDKRFVHLLKTRSLDPLSAKRMKDIRSRFFYLEMQLQEANTALDKLWDEFQFEEKKCLVAGVNLPSLELVYRAMTVNHEIAFNLRHTIDCLTTDVSRIKSGSYQAFRLFPPALAKATNELSPAMQKLASSFLQSNDAMQKSDTSGDLHSLSNMMLNVSVDSRPSFDSLSPFATPKSMSKARQAQLRNFLERRPVTHVHPATPVEEYSQLISPNFTVREFLQERESEEQEALSMLPLSLDAAARDASRVRESRGDSTMPVTDTTFATVTPPIFKPFFSTQLESSFLASQSAVCIHPRSAITGNAPKTTSTALLGLPSPEIAATSAFQSAFGSATTNIFTLAASASKSAKGSEQPIGLKIGGIPLETVVREGPAELLVPKSTPNQPKSPILTSLLDAKNLSTTISAATTTNSGAITEFALGFTGTRLLESGRTAVSASNANKVVAPSSSPFLLTKPTASAFSFSPAAALKPSFSSFPPYEFSQSKTLFASPTGFKESVNKPKPPTAYEDVTPPTSPHTYDSEPGYLVEEPGNGEEEEHEGEEEEQEDEEGDRGEDYEDQDAWEDENGETAYVSEYVPVENAHLREKEAVEVIGSVPLTNSEVVEEKGKTDAYNGARNDASGLPKSAIDMIIPSPIFKAASMTSAAASTLEVQDAAAPSVIDTVTESPVSLFKLSSPDTSAIDTTTSEATAVIFKPGTATDMASIITNLEESNAKALIAAESTRSAVPSTATTSFRFALPAGTTTKTPPSAFSFTMSPVSTSTSTFTMSTSPQSLFGSKLSFGPSEGSAGAATQDHGVSTPSIFGGSKPAVPFGTQQSSAGAFSFGQPGTSAFGTATTTAGSAFGQASGTFGQAQTTVFGQPSSSASATFGQQSSGPTSSTPPSAGGGSLFGQRSGSLFGGLGGKPNPENASKNIFGAPSTFGGAAQSSGLFESSTSQDSGISWNKPASGDATSRGFTGSGFSSASGSVSQSGFGFQQSNVKPGAFGGSAGFGSPPTFGGAPTFGSVGQMGSRLFGSPTAQPTGFGSFAAAASDVPTFGSLASQPSTLTFNSVATQQPVSPFGAPTQSPQAFGAAPSFASPAFGTSAQMNASSFGAPTSPAQPTAFGSPAFGSSLPAFGSQAQQPTQGSPSFSQWR